RTREGMRATKRDFCSATTGMVPLWHRALERSRTVLDGHLSRSVTATRQEQEGIEPPTYGLRRRPFKPEPSTTPHLVLSLIDKGIRDFALRSVSINFGLFQFPTGTRTNTGISGDRQGKW